MQPNLPDYEWTEDAENASHTTICCAGHSSHCSRQRGILGADAKFASGPLCIRLLPRRSGFYFPETPPEATKSVFHSHRIRPHLETCSASRSKHCFLADREGSARAFLQRSFLSALFWGCLNRRPSDTSRGYLGIAIQEMTPDLARAFNAPPETLAERRLQHAVAVVLPPSPTGFTVWRRRGLANNPPLMPTHGDFDAAACQRLTIGGTHTFQSCCLLSRSRFVR